MNRRTKLAIVTAGLAIAALLLVSGILGEPEDSADKEAITPVANLPQAAAPLEEDVGVGDVANPERCLSEGLLETHPMLMDEAERLGPYLVNSDSIAVYRNLTESELLNLVDQSDSGAMAVLGAMHVMRARGLPESKAVPYLLLEDHDLLSFRYSFPHTEEQTRQLELAADWFYKSALHGRVMALVNVGHQLDMMRKKPVDLGWVSEESYEQLTRAEKSIFNAANVYQAAADTIAPELEIGLFDDENGGFGTMFAQRFANIAEPIAEEFGAERRRLGLGPLTVPASDLPPFEELKKLLCDPADK